MAYELRTIFANSHPRFFAELNSSVSVRLFYQCINNVSVKQIPRLIQCSYS